MWYKTVFIMSKDQKKSYKIFGKKLLKTSRLVASTQVLTNSAIPTNDCDVVITFPPDPDTSVLMWLLDKLRERTPHIIVHVRHHSSTKGPVLHLTASHLSLLKFAEDLAIRKPLKEEYGGGMKEFTYEDQECFSGVEDEEFFTSQERQCILHYMLNNLRAYKGETLGKITFLEGQSIIPLLETRHIISQVFPLHSTEDLVDLRERWIKKFFTRQPLDKICDYFGVKIAMYFAYLGHYTMALLIPAIIGVLIWFIQTGEEGSDDMDLVIFALFNAIWATLYLEHWKRRSSELAYEWGTLDKKDELLEDPRPLFTGDLVDSPVTGRLEPYYPQWKRNLFRYFVTLPVVLLCLFVVFVVMMLIFQFQEWINVKVEVADYPGFLTVVPKILLAIIIGIFDDIYKKIALWLNEMENYRMVEAYENHLITKLAIFQFVNSFLSLFYIAFYLQDMDRLRDQLAAILITRQILGNIKEALLPYLTWQARLCKVGYDIVSDLSPVDSSVKEEDKVIVKNKEDINDETALRHRPVSNENKSSEDENPCTKDRRHSIYVKRSLKLTQAEVESEMKKYEDTLEDHLEMLIQFGYVTLFSSAFPLAALCALVNNIIEIRSDAFKLCMTHQRPFGQRVESIGTWQDALELMGVIAVGVNCALIGVSGQICRLLPITEISTVIIIIVVLEHAMLALKFLIAYAIPDVPEAIATKKARLEFLRREAWKRLESQANNKDQSVQRQFSKSNIFVQKQNPDLYSETPKSVSSVTYHSYKGHGVMQAGGQVHPSEIQEDMIVKTAARPANNVAPGTRPKSEPVKSGSGQIHSVTNPYATHDPLSSERRSQIKNAKLNLNIGKNYQTFNKLDDADLKEENQHDNTDDSSLKEINQTSIQKGDNQQSETSAGNASFGKNENSFSKTNSLVHDSQNSHISNARNLTRSQSVNSEHIEKYINRSAGTLNKNLAMPEEQIKKLLANSERRRSGTYVSSMTIPVQSTTQRKTIFSVVKTGQSSYKIPSKEELKQGKEPSVNSQSGQNIGSIHSVGNNFKKESSL